MVTEASKMALRSGARTMAIIQLRLRLAQARDRRLPHPAPRPAPRIAPTTTTVMQRWLDLNA